MHLITRIWSMERVFLHIHLAQKAFIGVFRLSIALGSKMAYR